MCIALSVSQTRQRHVQLTRCFSAVAEVFVTPRCLTLANCHRQNVANELQFLRVRGLYEFSRGLSAEGATNGCGAAKIGNLFRLIQRHFVRYLDMCGRL